MIQGIGTDIIEVRRVGNAIERLGTRFLDKVFTQEEQKYCLRYRESARHFAGRFAAKEAVVKSLGIGFRDGIHWLDVSILNDEAGKPYIELSENFRERAGSPRLLVSISHCRDYATAFVVAMPL